MSTYLKFRGALYRKADRRLDQVLSRPPGKQLTWGPDEWPSSEYQDSLTERPPLSQEEFQALRRQIEETKAQIARASSPEERRYLMRELGTMEDAVLKTRAWLHDKNPASYRQRLKHHASRLADR
jgi:hypothetical protein